MRHGDPLYIAVAGGGVCSERVARRAQAIGRAVAAAGAILVCGGLGGVMEAAARGAIEAGGIAVGLLPTYDRRSGNRFLTVAIPTGLGHARNVLVAAAGDALVALPGEHGTLSEVALARVLGRPVVVLGRAPRVPGTRRAYTPAAAVRLAIALARRRTSTARRRPLESGSQRRRGDGAPVRPRFRRLRSNGIALILSGRSRSQ